MKKYIKGYKQLVDMPYNQLNLDNYIEQIKKIYKTETILLKTEENKPIKLMAGQHSQAGILHSLRIPLFHIPPKKKIWIVGKGILFDSGGYDLKNDMVTMKTDMAGMACAIGVENYINSSQVIAWCPVSTNFLHNNQIIPGDQIKIGKKIVEVTNTDAEGRLILAEGLSNLDSRVKPNDIVITIATLTGCVGYAVGKKATGVFSPNDKLVKAYLQASEETKELAWRLPLWDYIQKKYNKKIIKNSDDKIDAGATEGAMFVKQFVKYPKNWIHLDIASACYNEDKSKATGEPFKTLVKFVKGLI